MKKALPVFLMIIVFCLGACDFFAGEDRMANEDSLRKIEIADSINKARGINIPGANDTGDVGIEGITRGMTEGLNKVQEGLDKMKKVTEVSTNRAKEISDGVNKTKNAVNKTIEEARKTLNGEK